MNRTRTTVIDLPMEGFNRMNILAFTTKLSGLREMLLFAIEVSRCVEIRRVFSFVHVQQLLMKSTMSRLILGHQ